MQEPPQHECSGESCLWPRIRDLSVLAILLAYVWGGIDPRLLHHQQALIFLDTPEFARQFFAAPGGPIDYLTRLVGQALSIHWLGTVILGAELAAVAMLTHFYCKSLTGRAVPLVRFVTPLLAVLMLGVYSHQPTLPASMIIGLAMALLYARLRLGEAGRMTLFIVLLLAGYYLADVAIVFFAPCAAIIQISRRPARPWGLAYLAMAISLPVLAQRYWVPYITFGYEHWFMQESPILTALHWLLFAFLPLTMLLVLAAGLFKRVGLAIWRRLFPRLAAAMAAMPREPQTRTPAERHFAQVVATAFLLIAAGGVLAMGYSREDSTRKLLYVEYYFSHEQWQEVLDSARDLSPDDYPYVACFDVDFSLHMLGRLGDEMFRFPQKRSVLLDFHDDGYQPYMLSLVDFCIRLGRINDAEHFAQESLTMFGPDGRTLRQLAVINIVKRQPGAARKFLAALAHDPLRGAWARQMLSRLESDADLQSDEEVGLLRRRMQVRDDTAEVQERVGGEVTIDLEKVFLNLLDRDPSNRTAFELLMAQYMLYPDLERARKLMSKIKDMTGPAYVGPDGRRRTPQHYQEAMAIYADKTGQPVNIPGFEIEPQTLQRMKEFQSIMASHRDRDSALKALWDKYRDSYFFYMVFGPGDYR